MLNKLLKTMNSLKQYFQGRCDTPYGITIPEAVSPLRKVLEYIGRKENRIIKLHGIQREKKKKLPNEVGNNDEWQDLRRRKNKKERIVLTPKEGVTLKYADLLKSFNKEVDPHNIGVQVQNLKITGNGSIRI